MGADPGGGLLSPSSDIYTTVVQDSVKSEIVVRPSISFIYLGLTSNLGTALYHFRPVGSQPNQVQKGCRSSAGQTLNHISWIALH